MTTAQTGTSRSVPPAEDFEKFANIEREFWQNHKACFLFETEATRVHINQSIIARDDFIIRTLERSLVEDMKSTLVQIGDVKQLQKVCLTPVAENNRLLREPPTSWDCRAPLLEECPQHHGHKGDPGVTPGTCGAIGERAQVILVWVMAPGRWERLPPTETTSHEG